MIRKPRGSNSTPQVSDNEDVATNTTNTTNTVNMNDLTDLPLVLIQHQLVKRGFHPGMVKKWDKPYCLFLLRESEQKSKGTCMRMAKFNTEEDRDKAMKEAEEWDVQYAATRPKRASEF